MTKEHLCIGGRFDGEWHSSSHPTELILPDFPDYRDVELSIDMGADPRLASSPTVQQRRYKKIDFHFKGENPQFFWMFEELTPGACFRKLLENYKP